MDVRTDPPLDESEQRALIGALERAGVPVDGAPEQYRSAWRAAGLRDALEPDEAESYAPSPRSTRGATRA